MDKQISKHQRLFCDNTLILGNKDGSKHEFVINKPSVVLRENLRETLNQSFWVAEFFGIFNFDGDGQCVQRKGMLPEIRYVKN